MANVKFSWDIKLFNLAGGLICDFPKAVNRQLSFALNGIDTCMFSLYLDDANAVNVIPRSTVIKVWRHITGDYTYSDPAGTPCFAGFVTRAEKKGEQNQMDIVAQNPFWRLQTKFHRNNWKLVIDYAGQNTELDVASGLPRGWQGGNMDGEKWDISAMCWKFIDLVNHQLGPAHGDSTATGIIKPSSGPPYWEKTIEMSRGRNVRRGTFVWQEINDVLDQTDSGGAAPDLIPEYINNGSGALMYFKTAPYRGSDKSGSVHMDFCTGSNNLKDFNETDETTPENFANYVWSVGNNDPETRRREAIDYGGALGVDSIGNYMFYRDSDSDDMRDNGTIDNQARSDLIRLSDRPVVYAIEQAPLFSPFYGLHYTIGDLVQLNANKGALQVSGARQRIYETTVSLSENCVETYAHRIADDFWTKVPVG